MSKDWVPTVLELDAKLGAIRSGPRVDSRKLLDDAAEALRVRVSADLPSLSIRALMFQYPGVAKDSESFHQPPPPILSLADSPAAGTSDGVVTPAQTALRLHSATCSSTSARVSKGLHQHDTVVLRDWLQEIRQSTRETAIAGRRETGGYWESVFDVKNVFGLVTFPIRSDPADRIAQRYYRGGPRRLRRLFPRPSWTTRRSLGQKSSTLRLLRLETSCVATSPYDSFADASIYSDPHRRRSSDPSRSF